MMQKNLPQMLTPHEIAAILQLSYDKTLAFVKYSGIDYIKVGRQYRVAEDKLTAFLMKKGRTSVDLNEPL